MLECASVLSPSPPLSSLSFSLSFYVCQAYTISCQMLYRCTMLNRLLVLLAIIYSSPPLVQSHRSDVYIAGFFPYAGKEHEDIGNWSVCCINWIFPYMREYKIKATESICLINAPFSSITSFYCLFIDLIVYLFPMCYLNTPNCRTGSYAER